MKLSKAIKNKLYGIVGKANASFSSCDLWAYAYDATKKTALPDAVIFPGSVDEVKEILKLANASGLPVTPRGAGSGIVGSSVPLKGGIVLVMNRLNKIIGIDTDNFIAEVQPGVITGTLHKAVEEKGLFYPPDPSSSSFSTIGGNLAQCAGGPRAVKYGVTRDYVLGLEAVTPLGDIIKTGVRTSKGVVGYDLTRLIVGSEGTLAVITSVILKLLPLPKSIRTMIVYFDSMERAASCVSEIMRSGIIPRTIEYMDSASIRCVENYAKIRFPSGTRSALIVEVDGNPDETTYAIHSLQAICETMGASECVIASSEEEVKKIWEGRKALSPAMYAYAPDKINEDIVVPRSKIPLIVKKIESLGKSTGLLIASFGHAGDGNIHVNIMLDKKNKTEEARAMEAVDILFDYTIELGGSISGEHGVGLSKKPYLPKEIGPAERELFKKIKQIFDPKGILNPGKIF